MIKPFEIALQEYGTQEILGSQHNPRILQYFAKTGNSWVHDDETAWCAAFMGFCLESSGIKSTKKLNARSYLDFGKQTKAPKLGDIAIFWREAKNSIYGHVAFYVKQQDGYIYCLGGNQSDGVCIAKYPVAQLLTFRTF